MTGYIYKYENKINHKVYIGQTVDPAARHYSHISKSRTVKSKFYNAVRKYGWENFDYSIIAHADAEDIKELSSLLDSLEIQYIEQYNSYKHGYNSTIGGRSCRGKEMPDSFIEYCKHRTYSEETRKKMSQSAHNRIVSEETREKHRQNAKKRNFAAYRELTTEKRTASIKEAVSKPVLQLDEEGNILKEFPSIREAVAYILENYAPNRAEKGIWKGLYRHFKGETKKRLYYGFEWKLKPIV